MASQPSGQNLPIITRMGGDFLVAYQDYDLKFALYNVRDGSHGVTAEIAVTSSNPALRDGELMWETVTLTSGTSRATAAKRLAARWPGGPDFEILMHEVCRVVTNRLRQGEPFVVLQGTKRQGGRYRLTPLLPEGEITMLWGDGGGGKSLFALTTALCVLKGGAYLGMAGIQGSVLYLDWETDEEEIDDRMQRLCEGLMITPPDMVYRRCFLPVADDLQSILRFISTRQFDLIVVDSMGLAVGGNPNDSGDTLRAMRALREFRTTVLALDHAGKGGDNATNTPSFGKAMGNSYKFHHARSVFELKRGESLADNVIEVGLFHHKANNGKKWAPMGFRFTFDGETGPIEVDHNVKASTIEGVRDRVTVARRILDALDGTDLTPAELQDQLDGVKDATYRQTMKRLTSRGLISVKADGKISRDKP